MVSLAVLSLLPVAAFGAGVYVSVGVGIATLNDANNTRLAIDGYPPLDVEASSDNGFALSGAVGYDFGNNWRLEGELAYRDNDLDQTDVISPGAFIDLLPEGAPQSLLLGKADADGDVSAITLMCNLYYDFDLGAGWTPYVGAGLGVAFISAESRPPAFGRQVVNDDDTVFAYQLGAGIAYEVSPDLTVSLDYRYLATEDPSLESSIIGRDFDSEYDGHYIGISVRF